MWNERKLVALTSGDNKEFLAYTSRLARLHHGNVARMFAETPTKVLQSAFNPTRPAALMTLEPESVALAMPTEVRYMDVPGRQPLPRLLEVTAQDDIDVLLAPETAGRSLVRGLAQRSACSIWFVPKAAPARFKRILVLVDFSVRAADGLRVATGLASLSGGECLALHVYFSELVYSPHTHTAELLRQRSVDYVHFTAPIDFMGVAVRPIFESAADVGTAALRVAEQQKADLIVVSCRGRSRFSNWLRPSIADQIIRHSRTPVLVVKHFGSQRSSAAVLREPPTPAQQLPGFN